MLAGPPPRPSAFKLGEKTDDPLAMYLTDVFTLPVNLAGIAGRVGAGRAVATGCRSGSS